MKTKKFALLSLLFFSIGVTLGLVYEYNQNGEPTRSVASVQKEVEALNDNLEDLRKAFSDECNHQPLNLKEVEEKIIEAAEKAKAIVTEVEEEEEEEEAKDDEDSDDDDEESREAKIKRLIELQQEIALMQSPNLSYIPNYLNLMERNPILLENAEDLTTDQVMALLLQREQNRILADREVAQMNMFSEMFRSSYSTMHSPIFNSSSTFPSISSSNPYYGPWGGGINGDNYWGTGDFAARTLQWPYHTFPDAALGGGITDTANMTPLYSRRPAYNHVVTPGYELTPYFHGTNAALPTMNMGHRGFIFGY